MFVFGVSFLERCGNSHCLDFFGIFHAAFFDEIFGPQSSRFTGARAMEVHLRCRGKPTGRCGVLGVSLNGGTVWWENPPFHTPSADHF